MKILLSILLILIIIILVLSLLIRNKNKTIKSQKNQINNLLEDGKEKEKRISNLVGEMQIEKSHSKELAKKLADISCMSIDDVMRQLQND